MTAWSLALLATVTAAFVGLDGIARGTALHAVLGPGDRPHVLAGSGPQLLLGHVWIIAAAGLLVGLFPRWESAVVAQAYWWVLAIAAGLVLRVAALGVAALGVPAPGARTGAGPGPARAALAVTGALATAAGTGGFLATAAGVWPVAGAAAVVALDIVLGAWALHVAAPAWSTTVAAALLLVPAVVLAVGGWFAGAAAVAGLVVAGTLLHSRPTLAGTLRRSRPVAAGTPVRTRPVLAGTLLTLAAVAPIAARWPELAMPGAGAVPAISVAAGPVGATLVTTVAGPAAVLVLAVQAWFWRTPRPVR